MKEKILTFELTKNKDEIEVFFNKEGLVLLKNLLNHIKTDNVDTDHVHLMSKEWGGDELTDESMKSGNSIINHVKMIYLDE